MLVSQLHSVPKGKGRPCVSRPGGGGGLRMGANVQPVRQRVATRVMRWRPSANKQSGSTLAALLSPTLPFPATPAKIAPTAPSLMTSGNAPPMCQLTALATLRPPEAAAAAGAAAPAAWAAAVARAAGTAGAAAWAAWLLATPVAAAR